MKTLDLTVIADRFCPTSRTYLTYMARAGLRPRKVLVVDFLWADAEAARQRRKWGTRIASYLMQSRRAPRPAFPPEFERTCSVLQRLVDAPIDYSADFEFAAHAERIAMFTATDFDDAGLHRRLARERSYAFLYTNGGRVPAALLARKGMRILHIHPGVVPAVRGSDGLLWSLLMRGRPAASCFFMNPGLDTGALIRSKEFPWPNLQPLAAELPTDLDLLYQAMLHAYDPHLRASLLVDILSSVSDVDELVATPQRADEGQAYTWMHPRLRARVLRSLLSGARAAQA